jgi:Icc-related predicted phosphoesterase
MSIVRIAAIADLHIGKMPSAPVQALLPRVGDVADVLLVCGDVTHHGRVEEAENAARELKRVRVPVLAVLGNHDFHADQQNAIHAVLESAGIQVLDGDTAEVHGIGFAGVKGFATGFGLRVLEPWGESIVKQFVHEAVNESLRLESALARLSTAHRIALLHYAPIRETVEGEPLEIHPFLGSSRLEEPLNRYRVTAAFHGHAHHGQPEGRTSTGIPVYNVSLPLLAALQPDLPLRVIEVEVEAPASP